MGKKKTKITSSKASIMQDTLLSCLGSFFAFLLVRWLSDPIYGFTLHFVIYMGCALVLTLLGQLISGSFRNMSTGVSYWARDRISLTILIKEAGLALLMAFDKGGFAQPVLIILAIVADALFSFAMIFYTRSFVSRIQEEDEAIKELSVRLNAVVVGDDDAAVTFADEARKSGRYNVLGLISRNPEMDRKVIGDYMIYYLEDDAAMEALQWRLGGIDCILFPKGGSGSGADNADAGGSGGEPGAIPMAGRMNAFGRFLKRAFDVSLSSILLIVFLPLIIICSLAVLIEDGAPVIYSQERIGKGGRPFRILKFRSMRRDAEAMGIPRLYSGENDPRLTRVGKFIRQHHLDELPQLWNVLRGDMSFIGYRPERQYYIDRIMEKNPRYRYLYQIRPGVTSYATLYNGYTDTLEKMLTRLDLDLYYLRNHSVWFDVRVLGLTFLRIVGGKKF
jgi:lipopolysaccharide/colanic/teichoic acid biosynthesis glycosyltransferase